MEENDSNLKALENFIVGNAELEKLEAMLDRFNIFEAVGMERQEIRHSKFLAFLLDPNESHEMGDTFVKRLLQRAVMDSPNVSAPVTPIELSLWDFGEMSVRREWRRIDIFLHDERNRLAVIVENKIGAGEHGDQLSRYYEAVREEYPEHKILALYLTPDGDEPSHPEYFPVDYRAVCGILDELAESRASVAEPDAKVLIKHYTEMLRRHIVGDSEIARLSRQIYQRHSRAIELIYEHRFAQREAHSDLLMRLIKETSGFSYQSRSRIGSTEFIGFAYANWSVAVLRRSRKSAGNNVVTFSFANRQNSLDLKLHYHSTDEGARSKVLRVLTENFDIFYHAQAESKELQFFRAMLPADMYENATDEEREDEIRKNWDDFLKNDLPRIDAALKKESWIWDSEESETPSGRSDRFTWGEGDIQILNRSDEESEGDEE